MAVKLSAPWYTLYCKISAIFEGDPHVDVRMDEDEKIITLIVRGAEKASAIRRILPADVMYGGENVSIVVLPDKKEDGMIGVYRDAFFRNPIVQNIYNVTSDGDTGFVVFKPEVLQYWNDNLGDPNGLTSVLPHDIAKEIFEDADGVFFTVGRK